MQYSQVREQSLSLDVFAKIQPSPKINALTSYITLRRCISSSNRTVLLLSFHTKGDLFHYFVQKSNPFKKRCCYFCPLNTYIAKIFGVLWIEIFCWNIFAISKLKEIRSLTWNLFHSALHSQNGKLLG